MGVMIPDNDPAEYKPYWDYENSLDGCDQMEFPIGIAYPQNMQRSTGPFTHLLHRDPNCASQRGVKPYTLRHANTRG